MVVCDGVEKQQILEELDRTNCLAGSRIVVDAETPAPSLIRRQMFLAAADCATDAVVCFDADDVPTPGSIGLHMEALRNADFSYGDMYVIDERGALTGPTFFARSEVPDVVNDPAEIAARNFLGLTNCAVDKEKVLSVAGEIPRAIDAVDWWLFTRLLEAGGIGRRTCAPVVSYRVHDNSMLGDGTNIDLVGLKRQTDVVLRHFDALGRQDSELCILVRDLRSALGEEPELVRAGLREAGTGGVWYEGLFRVARWLRENAH